VSDVRDRTTLAASLSEFRSLLVELSRWSRVAERNGDLHARIASALARSESGLESSAAADAVGERQGRQPAQKSPLTFRIRYALAMVVPDVIVQRLPAPWRRSVLRWVYPPRQKQRKPRATRPSQESG